MSLKHALLGFINYSPMTGYELKKFFDASVAHFWNAELSQIYPALKSMESEGLVEMKVCVQEDRPNRKEYSITELGRRELVEWLGSPAEPEQVREPLLIKVFFGAALPKERLLAVMREYTQRLKYDLQMMQQIGPVVEKFAHMAGLQRDAPFWRLTIGAGQKVHGAEMEFAEEAIRRIEEMDDSFFSGPSREYPMDVRSATDILERMKSAVPERFSSMQAQGYAGAKEKPHQEPASIKGGDHDHS
jgi:DNA-binding PadR family transcriptional regulator